MRACDEPCQTRSLWVRERSHALTRQMNSSQALRILTLFLAFLSCRGAGTRPRTGHWGFGSRRDGIAMWERCDKYGWLAPLFCRAAPGYVNGHNDQTTLRLSE